MTDQFDEIERRIIEELDDFFGEAEENEYRGNKIWTSRLKEKIGDLGFELGYKVCCGSFPEKFENEWLFDLVWYLTDNENRLQKVELIVESEWDKKFSEIKYDFEKLLVGNAKRRLLICQSNFDEIENLFEKFKSAIEAFDGVLEGRFLIAILDSYTEADFYFKAYSKKSS